MQLSANAISRELKYLGICQATLRGSRQKETDERLLHYLLTFNKRNDILLLTVNRRVMSGGKSDVLQGTLDLIVLKTLETLGPTHGYGIAVRIQQVSANILQLNQGTLYPALLRLEQKGWIKSEWGESENKRRARFYSLTKAGKKQLREETADWERFAGVMQRVLAPAE
jgi:PadR family transcriptional regulator PadR